jgi:hypothetical protein
MKPNVLRIAPLLAVAVLGVLLVTPLLGRGEDAPTALDEYARYLPGNPVPTNLTCDTIIISTRNSTPAATLKAAHTVRSARSWRIAP